MCFVRFTVSLCQCFWFAEICLMQCWLPWRLLASVRYKEAQGIVGGIQIQWCFPLMLWRSFCITPAWPALRHHNRRHFPKFVWLSSKAIFYLVQAMRTTIRYADNNWIQALLPNQGIHANKRTACLSRCALTKRQKIVFCFFAKKRCAKPRHCFSWQIFGRENQTEWSFWTSQPRRWAKSTLN